MAFLDFISSFFSQLRMLFVFMFQGLRLVKEHPENQIENFDELLTDFQEYLQARKLSRDLKNTMNKMTYEDFAPALESTSKAQDETKLESKQTSEVKIQKENSKSEINENSSSEAKAEESIETSDNKPEINENSCEKPIENLETILVSKTEIIENLSGEAKAAENIIQMSLNSASKSDAKIEMSPQQIEDSQKPLEVPKSAPITKLEDLKEQKTREFIQKLDSARTPKRGSLEEKRTQAPQKPPRNKTDSETAVKKGKPFEKVQANDNTESKRPEKQLNKKLSAKNIFKNMMKK